MKVPEKLKCNACEKEIRVENGILREDVLVVKKKWGYFSDRDLQEHNFCLCESCYNIMIQGFKIPVEIIEHETVFPAK